MQWAHYAAFFREFFRQPMQLGTFVPSSRFLERRVLRLADVQRARVVVELGPGVGGITSRALESLPLHSKLVAVELSTTLARVLRTWEDPRLIVHEGSAEEFGNVLKASNLARPDVIISGIPLSVMPGMQATDLLNGAWETLAPGGRMVIYQFRRDVERLATFEGLRPTVEIEPLNLPPLRVYCWSKPLEARSRLSGRLLRSRVAGAVSARGRGDDARRRPRRAFASNHRPTRTTESDDSAGSSSAVRQIT